MRAYVLEPKGKIPVLRERKTPVPRPDEVLVRTSAVAIHPVDLETVAGGNAMMLSLSRPFVPGVDFAGIVLSTGENVRDLPEGTVVYGYRGLGAMGAWAEELVVPRSELARAPAGLDPQTLATLPLPALCALQALTNLSQKPGSRILVHGGAGAVGSVAVQIFAARGLHVIATASSRDREWVTRLGAHQVIDYRAPRFEDETGEVDGVFDTVGGDTLSRSFGVVRAGGAVTSLAGMPRVQDLRDAGMSPPFPVAMMLPLLAWPSHRRASRLGARFEGQVTVPSSILLEQATAIAENGGLQTRIDRVFEWGELAAAVGYASGGKLRGRVVIVR